VTAVVGTHTHVRPPTRGSSPAAPPYITDVGMTGPRGGVIGVKREQAVEAMTTKMPVRFETSTEDPWLNGVVITTTGGAAAGRVDRAGARARSTRPLTPSGGPPADALRARG